MKSLKQFVSAERHAKELTKLNKMIATTWSDPTRPIGEKILQQAKLPTRGLKENYSRKRTSLAPKTWLEYMYSDYIM